MKAKEPARINKIPKKGFINELAIEMAMKTKEELNTRSTTSSSSSSSSQESEKIGPSTFTPIQLLGKGSFGEVYLVKKRDTNELFAMKVLSKKKIFDNHLTKYAVTERNILSYIHHPFIVSLRFAFQTTTKLFLIMDYGYGGDLGHVLQKEKTFTEERAKIYLSEILLALEELHSHDIIYRDLKPDNVVLDKDGHALLTDFGLSKERVADFSLSLSFSGSIAYLAPEMISRQGHGKSIDWYLLGVLLYEMIVGYPPYFNKNKYFSLL
jgi:serine/threonine protein kinase